MKSGIGLPPDMQQMVIEHRWMHAETICYLLHQLDPGLKRRVATATSIAPAVGAAHSVHRNRRGRSTVSASRMANSDGTTNFRRIAQKVPAFEISKHKVTNGEYLRFVEDGGAAPLFWHAHRRCVAAATHVR